MIPLRVPARYRLTFPVISVALIVGCLLWIALAPSWEAFVVGGLTIGSLVWVWGIRLAARRASGGSPNQLVLTKDAISSPLFTLSLDRIERAWIGRTSGHAGELRVLNIEPIRSSDVRWVRSRFLRLNARVADRPGVSPIRILEVNIDRPLEELVDDLERRAGRRLLSPEHASPPG